MKQEDRLTPEQFKSIVIGKGWTFKSLAEHWGITPVWVSNVSRDPLRAKHYDDAVFGLPSRTYLARSIKARNRIAEAYTFEHNARQHNSSKTYRYHAHLKRGTIVSVMEDVGSLADVGMRGCVFDVRLTKGAEEYGLIFENGKLDWFTADYIDRCVVLTGLEDINIAKYNYTSDADLHHDFNSRLFCFHP